MQKPIEYYLSLPPELVDMDDPDTPETIKIRARNALEKQAQAKKEETELQRKKATTNIAQTLLNILSIIFPFLSGR